MSDESVAKGFEYVRQKYGDRIVSVIHLAAYYSFSKGSWHLYEEITIKGTARMLENAKKFKCEQFLFSSTQLIHKPCEVGEKINEDSPIEGSWDYPRSKIATEAEIKEQHGDIPAVILRIVGCYDDECHSIPISNQIQRIYENQLASRVFPGDLTHGAPFMHLDDCAEAIWLAVQKRAELPKYAVFLIGEDSTMSTDEMQRTISRLIRGKEFTTIRIPKWLAWIGAGVIGLFVKDFFIQPWMMKLSDQHYELDITRARKMLGWSPKTSIRATLPKMIAFLKNDPLRFYETNGLKAPNSLKRKYGK
jgi:nucleoside-diphosphate-sugar epimerase